MKHNLSMQGNTTVLHGILDDTQRLRPISEWCQKQGWKCVFYNDMRGSEDDVIIMYDVACWEMEPYSRAKNCLIILQK